MVIKEFTQMILYITKSLGLCLVTILAEEQLGGTINVDTSKGTTFQIRIGANKKKKRY